uniref:G-protein coupled receptors family 1 profile domain-containing protein n=1 Tax=Clytia hemisphaerica TaxID=252671 RepID=A0A7M5VH03_9CNID
MVKVGYLKYLSLAVMFTVFSQCTGVSTLLTVSWLRYLSITKPLLIVKATWVLLTIGLEFILTLTISLYTFFVYLRKSTAHMIAANFLVLVIYLSLSSIILIGFNLKSFTSLGQQQRRMSMYDDNTRNSKRNNRAVLTLALITSCYLICTVPYIIYSCMLGSYLYSENAELLKYFRYLESFIYVQALYLLNCGLTAMIYVCRNKRHFLKRRVTTRSRIGQQKLSVGLKQRRHQNESSETISSSTSAV